MTFGAYYPLTSVFVSLRLIALSAFWDEVRDFGNVSGRLPILHGRTEVIPLGAVTTAVGTYALPLLHAEN